MEAMASVRLNRRLSQLWQFPLLILSLGLFGYAAFLFIHPAPGMTLDQKIDVARTYLKQDRPTAALSQLNELLADEQLDREHEGTIHLLIAQSLEDGQKQASHQRAGELSANYRAVGNRPAAGGSLDGGDSTSPGLQL